MSPKQRLSVSVDAVLVEAAEDAMQRGETASVSAWVNDALRLKLDQERRLLALSALIEAHEEQYGVITDEEIAMAARRASSRALAVRGAAAQTTRKRRRRRKAR